MKDATKSPMLPRAMRSSVPLHFMVASQAVGRARLRRKERKSDFGRARPSRRRSYLYSILSGKSHKWGAKLFKWTLTCLILVSVMSFILETMESLKQQYDHIFNTIEAASSFFFLFEYLLRVYVITEHKRYAHPIYGRLRYMRSFHAVIDFLSFSPFFLECMSSGLNLPTLTWLRMLRIFRILKTEKYTQSFATVYRVVWFNREVLGVALLICLMMIVITSSLLYFFKPGVEEETSDFSSIPATFYLAVLMLTGQGQPEGVLPVYTKVMVAVTAIFSVPVFVIPASMLTWGFEAEAERRMKKSVERMRKVREAKLRGEDPSSSDSSNSSAGELVWEEDEEIWREYQDVILGHESEADEEGEQVEIAARARKIKEKALKLFTAVDRERDGHVTMDELRSFVLRQKMAHQSRLEEAQMKEGQQPNVGSSPSRWYSRLHSPLHTVNADINDKDEKTKKDSKNNMATPLLQNAAHSVGGYGIESQELHSLAGRNSGPSNAGGKHTGRYSSPSTERRERQRARLQDRQDVLDTDLQRFFNEVDLDNNQVITLDDLERIDFSTYIHSSDERRSKSLLAQAITTADGDTGASKTGMSARAVENKERNNYRESKLNNAGGGGDAGYAQLEGRMDQLESKLDGMSSQIAEIKALFLQMHAKGFK